MIRTYPLLPCPFCGGPAEMDTQQTYRDIITGLQNSSIAVYCTLCSAQNNICRGDSPDVEPEDVVALWNRRDCAKSDDVELRSVAMLAARLTSALKKVSPDHQLLTVAVDYLRRKGLTSPLRDDAQKVSVEP